MNYKYLVFVLAVLLIVTGLAKQGWCLLICWLGLDFAVLGIAYHRGIHGIFGKRVTGTLPIWSWIIFLPLFVYTTIVWHVLRLIIREPASNIVSQQLVVGRRLLPKEFQGTFDNFVDLTAEFAEPSAIRESPAYFCFPVLDRAAPTPEALWQAVNKLHSGKTFVHCAQGHGRTGLFAAAILLNSRTAHTIDEALQILKAARPGISLSNEQHCCINEFFKLLG